MNRVIFNTSTRTIRGIISTAISQTATLLSCRGTIDANRDRNGSR